MYYKHQKGGEAVSFIAGRTREHAFIQVITNDDSYYFDYPVIATESEADGKQSSDFKRESESLDCFVTDVPRNDFKIGESSFSNEGIWININQNGISIIGEIRYSGLTPLKYDIMGPFKYLPMQCKHKVVSLHHRLKGFIRIDGKVPDFTDGIGYIEGDYGKSFPENYLWLQCNDFADKASIMVSVADIPFLGFGFRGCICVVHINGKEYRFTTYLGAKIIECNEKRIVLKQGKFRLEIDIAQSAGHKLMAPQKGKMNREISERIACGASFKLWENGLLLFDESSENASFEYVGCL